MKKLFLLFVFIIMLSSVYTVYSQGSRQQDSLALVALYNATDGKNWDDKNGWLTKDPLEEWKGITILDGRVIEIRLSENNLNGKIPHEIGNLKNLRILYLNRNLLSGELPEELYTLYKLKGIWLQGNSISGSINPAIENLIMLEQLRLQTNKLSGIVPDELSKLQYLEDISLGKNELSGSIPEELKNLDSLVILHLYNNNFTNCPDFSTMKKLTYLSIQNNKLEFDDIEYNVGIKSFHYAPQDSVGQEQEHYLNKNQQFTLSVEVGGLHNKYQWYHDGLLIEGATNSDYIIESMTPSLTGKYVCKITNTVATELTLYSKPIWIFLDPSSVEVNEVADEVSIYPNPANDFINIPEAFGKIEIYSTLCRKVMEINNPSGRIDISRLPAGVYYISINGRFEKFVKI